VLVDGLGELVKRCSDCEVLECRSTMGKMNEGRELSGGPFIGGKGSAQDYVLNHFLNQIKEPFEVC
jgi:hypothetical protein